MSDEQQNTDTLTTIRARKSPLTPAERATAQSIFLEALKTDGNVTNACNKAGISRDTAYQWKEKYKEFGHKWNDVQERFNDRIRQTFVQRGIDGYEEPVISLGRVVVDEDGQPMMMRKYSDTLLLALARSRMPEFREKQQVEHSGSLTIKTEWGGGALEEEDAGGNALIQ